MTGPTLALGTALAEAVIGLVLDDRLLAEHRIPAGHGFGERLAPAVRALLAETGQPPALIVGVIGPGSFTGLRTGLSLAHGLSLGFSCPLAGVTTGEALRFADARSPTDAPLWVASDARAGRVFFEPGDGTVTLLDLDTLPPPPPGLRLGGDAAASLLEHLAASGIAVTRFEPPLPGPLAIARAGLARHEGRLAPDRAPLPLYVEPPGIGPAASHPAAGR